MESEISLEKITSICNKFSCLFEEAQNIERSLDNRFVLAYRAVFQLNLIIIHASGKFMQDCKDHHKAIFNLLPELMGSSQKNRSLYYSLCCRPMQNQIVKKEKKMAQIEDVEELIADIKAFKKDVVNFLKEKNFIINGWTD